MSRILCLSGILLCFYTSQAQSDPDLSGTVSDREGQPLTGITVLIQGTTRGDATDAQGGFTIAGLRSGTYLLEVSGIGYKTEVVSVDHPGKDPVRISLQEDVRQLQDVIVVGNTDAAKIKSTGLNVSVIDVEQYQDMNLDINQLLGVTSGINLRESGGLGSSFQLSLNGLSGNQVRYFVDGIPMEFFGSALSLNNLPANMLRSIEVYKGVVPVELASDALGGSINVITADPREEFLDLSYSFGSFNTHRASAIAQTQTKNGIFFRLSSFFNHSDNNYWMDDVPVTDELGNVTSTDRVRRFHDDYTSGSISLKTGLVDKAFANELSGQFIYAGNRNNIQHPDVSINRVFGGLNSRNSSWLGGVTWRKSWNTISLQSNILAGRVNEVIYDTLSRRYNWYQEYKDLSADNAGEYYGQRSVFHIDDDILRANLLAQYSLARGHELSLNLAHNQLRRNGFDEINENNNAFTFPNELNKDIVAFSYNFTSNNKKWQASAFAKKYFFRARINAEEYIEGSYQNVETRADMSNTGYGITGSYLVRPELTAKLSYEKAYRLPEPDEILGDGMFVTPNPQLTPESSHNINAGILLNKYVRGNKLNTEINAFYRPAQDFIRFVNDRGIYGSYYNVSNVRIIGVETSGYYKISNKYLVGLNLTYQSITDRTEFYEGLENTNYGQKIPNTPYFFWNARFGYNHVLRNSSRLSFTWTASYVHSFFLYWENLGYRGDKNRIPTQFTHDLDINYSFADGKYSASLAARNIFDARAYDNFNIQKPGRAFYLKIRYNLNTN